MPGPILLCRYFQRFRGEMLNFLEIGVQVLATNLLSSRVLARLKIDRQVS